MISTLIQEEWRPIKNYEGLYDVSNFGRIRSIWHGKTRILKLSKTEDGYLRVHLYKEGKQKQFFVHRLVWEAFNGTIPDGYEINHTNEFKTDCSVWNLNLLTHKANMNWGTRNQRASEKLTNGKRSDPVLQLTLDDELVKEWPSIREAHRNGYNKDSISLCCQGKRKTYKGFKWMKKESVL